jgi:hypothetical protein
MQAGNSARFFVAGRDASELLEEFKETLDEVAFGVEGEVTIARDLRFDFGGMTGLITAVPKSI